MKISDARILFSVCLRLVILSAHLLLLLQQTSTHGHSCSILQRRMTRAGESCGDAAPALSIPHPAKLALLHPQLTAKPSQALQAKHLGSNPNPLCAPPRLFPSVKPPAQEGTYGPSRVLTCPHFSLPSIFLCRSLLCSQHEQMLELFKPAAGRII